MSSDRLSGKSSHLSLCGCAFMPHRNLEVMRYSSGPFPDSCTFNAAVHKAAKMNKGNGQWPNGAKSAVQQTTYNGGFMNLRLERTSLQLQELRL